MRVPVTLWFSLAAAWDADGHSAIGMTCMSGVKASALTHLKRLLGGKDIVDIAPWSNQLTNKYPEMKAIYRQEQERALDESVVNCDYFKPDENCSNGHCILSALSYYFDTLMLDSVPSSDYTPPANLKLAHPDLIRLVVSLVGELHSLSRYGYTDTDSGRDSAVAFIDSGKKIDTTLYDYWDAGLTQKTIKDRPHFWFSGWTHMNNLSRQIIATEQEAWNKHENKTVVFEQWARSTFKEACTKAYRIRNKQPLYARISLQLRSNGGDLSAYGPMLPKGEGGETERFFAHPANFIIPSNHMFADFDLIKQQILLGGLRLSFVINHILSHKDAKRLRVGSAMNLQDSPIASHSGMWAKQKSSSDLASSWTTNLVINMGIIGVLVLGFLAFLNFTGDAASKHAVAESTAAAKAAKQ